MEMVGKYGGDGVSRTRVTVALLYLLYMFSWNCLAPTTLDSKLIQPSRYSVKKHICFFGTENLSDNRSYCPSI